MTTYVSPVPVLSHTRSPRSQHHSINLLSAQARRKGFRVLCSFPKFHLERQKCLEVAQKVLEVVQRVARRPYPSTLPSRNRSLRRMTMLETAMPTLPWDRMLKALPPRLHPVFYSTEPFMGGRITAREEMPFIGSCQRQSPSNSLTDRAQGI